MNTDHLFSSLRESLRFSTLCLACAFLLLPSPLRADVEQGIAAYQRQDYQEALIAFRAAAEQGHAWAQYDLGSMYQFGHGVEPDAVVAYALYNLAAATEEIAKQSRDRLAPTLSRDQLANAQTLSEKWTKALAAGSRWEMGPGR